METAVLILPHVNASLNALASVLLVAGYALIKSRRETAHKWTMLTCFGVSALFLACYLAYHTAHYLLTGEGSVPFPREQYPAAAWVYFPILISHVALAAAVPVLAIISIYYGLRDRRATHVRLSRWTFPIWLYVSVTGVVVYAMLYHLFPR